MKTIYVLILVLFFGVSAHAQNGAVNFANRLSGVFDAPVTVIGSGIGAGELGAQAQLYVVNGSALTPVGTPIIFRGTTEPLAKYFDGGSVELPGTSVGGTVTLRVLVWVGSTFDTGSTKGQSADFTIANLGGGTLPPSNLETMKGFFIAAGPIIPEPSPLALLVLGVPLFIARFPRAAMHTA